MPACRGFEVVLRLKINRTCCSLRAVEWLAVGAAAALSQRP